MKPDSVPMVTSLIALIRHGDYQQKANTPSAWQPFGLHAEGIAEVRHQAQQFAQLLQKNHWLLSPKVHSSPLLRAWQTAQLFIETLQDFFPAPPEHLQFSALAERSVGSVANLSITEIEQLLIADPRFDAAPAGWKSDSHYCLPFMGAESLYQAGSRVAQHIEQHTQSAQTNQIQLFFGHGAALRHAACHLNVMQLCDVSQFSMYHAHPVILSKDSHGWQQIAGQWKLRKQGSEAKD